MAKTKEMKIEGITESRLDEMIEHWERFKSCYFWSPPCNASGRRSEEKRHARDIDFLVDGIPCNYSVQVSCSCRNYYCSRDMTEDGRRKAQGLTFLRKIKKYGVFT